MIKNIKIKNIFNIIEVPKFLQPSQNMLIGTNNIILEKD
jgi:hypothetical protein